MHAGVLELAGAFQFGGHIQMPVHHLPKLGDLAWATSFYLGHPALLIWGDLVA
jgi:hypothetical protein